MKLLLNEKQARAQAEETCAAKVEQIARLEAQLSAVQGGPLKEEIPAELSGFLAKVS